MHVSPCPADFTNGAEITPDLATRYAAVAIIQAHVVIDELHDIVIPRTPPAKRTLAVTLARRLERRPILADENLRDLETLGGHLEKEVAAGTHLYWHGDENHVRGGYPAMYRETEAEELAGVANDIALLAEMILAALSAAKALQEAASLFDG